MKTQDIIQSWIILNLLRIRDMCTKTFFQDNDECWHDAPCHVDSWCNNTAGSYECWCNVGYYPDTFDGDSNVTCLDIDECANSTLNDCHQYADCTNTNGSFYCNCTDGFSGNGTYCEDIDECVVSPPCDTVAVCNNTIGSFNCTCNDGYEGTGLAGDCSDIDECVVDEPCHANATCLNLGK